MKKYFLEYSKTELYKKRLELSKNIIKDALDNVMNPYISFSGGKDSTVVMNLVREQNKNIKCIYWDDEFILNTTKEYLKNINNLKIHKNKAIHCEWFITNKNFEERKDIDKNYDCCFLGLRAEENSYRKKYLRKYGLIYKNKMNNYLINPIGWWRIEDVWAYIYSNNIKYNEAYDIMTNKKIAYNSQRIGPFANKKAISYGQIFILKKCFPEEYRKFIYKFPEAKAYV